MGAKINILKDKDRVIRLLNKKYHLRDCDFKLVANLWHEDVINKGLDPKEMTVFEFLKIYSEGSFTNPQSIKRLRAKLQEEYKELRGDKFNQRHGMQQDVVEDLNTV